MYYVQKVLKKIIPEALTFFLTPLITMILVVPVTLIVLGPIGNQLSGYIAAFCIWLTNTLGFIAQPILSAIYPYMVMFGLDKGCLLYTSSSPRRRSAIFTIISCRGNLSKNRLNVSKNPNRN